MASLKKRGDGSSDLKSVKVASKKLIAVLRNNICIKQYIFYKGGGASSDDNDHLKQRSESAFTYLRL